MNNGVIDRIYGVVKSGKEARIYRGIAPDGDELAVKIYLTGSAEFKKGMMPYIEGDARFTRVRHETRSLIYLWALKEFKNLKKAYEIGVKVPKPIAVEKNILVMEFIGQNGVPYPLMKEAEIRKPKQVYMKLLEYIKKLYNEGKIVHGDLSEFNIMIKDDEPIIFDMSQAVLIDHPMAEQFLLRDIINLNRFFKRLNVKVRSEDAICRWIKQK
jgi:RIO kinase 1